MEISHMNNSKTNGTLTRLKAADYLSISLRHLDEILRRGEIPKIKIGRKTVVRIVDVDAYIENNIHRE